MAIDWLGDITKGATAGAGIGSVVPGFGTAIGGLAGAATGLGLGLWEYNSNKKQIAQDESNRPQYQIPAGYQQNLTQLQQQSLEGLPAEQKQQFLNNLEQGQAYGLNQLSTRNSGLAGVSQVNQNLNNGFANLLSADSQARINNQDKLIGARNQLSDQQAMQFQLNQLNHYNETVARNSANRGGLYQNVNNATQVAEKGLIGSGLGNLIGGDKLSELQKAIKNYNGAGGGQQPQGLYNYDSQMNPQGLIDSNGLGG